MDYIQNFIFFILLSFSIGLFIRNTNRIIRNIKLGKDINRNDQKKKRWIHMASVALGQSKMIIRPISGFLHFVVYIGFILINIELL